jgi:hypothetical protein
METDPRTKNGYYHAVNLVQGGGMLSKEAENSVDKWALHCRKAVARLPDVFTTVVEGVLKREILDSQPP